MKFLDYIQGYRRGKEANELEKKSLADPFLSDAIDGFDSVDGDHLTHIAEMQAKVQKERMPSKAKRAWRVVAAAMLFFAVISSYLFLQDEHNYSEITAYITQKPEEKNQEKDVKIAVDMTNHNLSEEVLTPQDRIYMSDELEDKSAHADIINKNIEEAFSNSTDTSAFVLSENRKLSETSLLDNDIIPAKAPVKIQSEAIKQMNSHDIVSDQEPEKFALNETQVLPSQAKSEVKDIVSEKKDKNTSKLGTNHSTKADSDKWFIGALEAKASEENINSRTKNDQLSYLAESSQSKNNKKSIIDKKESEPIIGRKGYRKYIEKNIRYPKKGKCSDIKGKVVLEFNVTKSGRPINIKVIKSLCFDLDQEAIRLLRLGSDWTTSDKRTQWPFEFERESKK